MHKSIMIAAMALVIAAPALAQVGPAPTLKPAATRAPAQAPVSRISQSPLPTLDEGTVERIAGAMLSLSALEVQGGWPTLPPSVGKLAPGARGPDVALLRRRLAITEDLPAALAEGDAYDDALVAAVRRFQVRHGLPEIGSVGAKTLAALNVPLDR
jgi:murein L,D-transpeptidase YcbB/YkuD